MTANIDPDTERAYDQAQWAPNMGAVLARYARTSDATRAAIGAPKRFAYGPGAAETLDVYRAEATHAPVVVFVHGGGWRGGAASEYAFPAAMLRANGIHYAAIDFSSVADTGGDLSALIDQVRRAVVWVHQNAASFGGDGTRVYLVGHSSGAHLAAMALSTRWTEHGLPERPFKGGLLVSGIYNLEPLRRTSRAAHVTLDDRTVQDASPIRALDALSSDVAVAVGGRESPAFQRQADAYVAAAHAAGKTARLIALPAYNHFEIIETLASADGALGGELLAMINS